MSAYPSYKDSGVVWIGEIPSEWVINPLGLAFDINGRIGWKSLRSDEYVDETNYIFLSTPNLKGKNIDYENVNYITKERYDESPEIKLYIGDILLVKSGSTLGIVNVVRYLPKPSTVNGSSVVLRSQNNSINPYYYYHFLKSNYFQNIMKITQSGVGVPSVNQSDIRKIKIPLPPLNEQQQISDYLDYKNSKIDTLIEKTEQKIELLKEQRTSLINTTVTKGLNPNIEMKDSGVEWIGEIPIHWKYIPLKYVTIEKNGVKTGPFGTQLNTKDYVDKGIKVLNQKTLIKEDYTIGKEYISEEKFELLKSFEVTSGDLILGTRGSFGKKNRTTFGKCSIVPKSTEISVLHPCLIRIRLDRTKVDKNYFKFYTNESSLFLEEIFVTSNSTTIEVIYGVTLKDIKYTIPPLSEQQQIVDYLDKEKSKIDTLVDIETKRVRLLKEYRQSLISNVVTGKVDVRNEVLV